MDNDPDIALVARYRGGDQAAFAELVVRYQRPIYNAAYWVVRRPEDASDVTQNVFLKVAEHLDDFDPQYRFFSWIYRIAVNEALNMLRRNGRDEPLDDEVELPDERTGSPEQQFGESQVKRQVWQALMGMSTNDRTVLVLRHFSECSYKEIGQILDLDEKTVKSRLFEARHRLRDVLKDLSDR